MRNFKRIFFAIFPVLISMAVFAQDNKPAVQTAKDSGINANTVLVACAAFLAIVIAMLGNVLKSSMDYHKDKVKKSAANAAKVLMLLVGVFFLNTVSAQEKVADLVSGNPKVSESDFLKWILLAVIVLELIIIFAFVRWIKYFTGVEEFVKSRRPAKQKTAMLSLKAIWEKMNRFKPMEKEADIDTGHSYDGIRELDNVTPPWFKAAFILSIIFAIGYLWRYHVAQSAPMQVQEYEMEVAEAKLKHDEYLKTQANNVDETTVKMLGQSDIDAGAAVYKTNCIACHGDKGQGGVGPNLTDEYWLHNGSVQDIFKSIKYGWQDKGMKSWKDDFSPNQIAQLTSYIKSLKGTNPAGAKEAQGEIYVEATGTSTDSTTVKTDSAKVATK